MTGGLSSGHAEVFLFGGWVGWVLDEGAAGDVADVDDLLVVGAEDESVFAWDGVGEGPVGARFFDGRFGGFVVAGAAAGGGFFWIVGLDEAVVFLGFLLFLFVGGLHAVALFLDFLLFLGGGGGWTVGWAGLGVWRDLRVWIAGCEQRAGGGDSSMDEVRFHGGGGGNGERIGDDEGFREYPGWTLL